jgi:hypothetical protein
MDWTRKDIRQWEAEKRLLAPCARGVNRMSTYLIHGIPDRGRHVSVIMDVPDEDVQSAYAVAQKIVGPKYNCRVAQRISVAVPENAKGIVFDEPSWGPFRLPSSSAGRNVNVIR